MRILHVVRGLSNSSGTTHIVGPLSEEQARQGCDVSVYYVEKSPGYNIEPNEQFVRCTQFPLTLPFSNPGISAPFATAVRRTVMEFDVVHIHAVWNFPTYLAMRTAYHSRVPYVVAPQGSFEPWALRIGKWRKKAYGQLFEIPLLNKAAFIQALTFKEAEQVRWNRIRAPIRIIPNGVDEVKRPQVAPPLGRRLNLDPAQKTLLFLSRLHPKKGVDLLLWAFAKVAKLHDDVTLVVAGDDAGSGYKTTLIELAVNLGVYDKCRFIGEVGGKEKLETLLGADAFALLSHSEGLPIAVLEAMATGLPVVISDSCNLPEVAEYEAGEVLSGNLEESVQALLRIFGEPSRAAAMGENGRRLIKEKFSWPRIARQTIDAYEQANAHAR